MLNNPEADNSADIKTRIQSINHLLARHAFDEARMVFDSIEELPRDDISMLAQLGSISVRLGENIAAINIYSELIEQQPDNASYLDGLAQAYVDCGRLDEARYMLKKAIDANPDYYRSYLQLGYIANQQNEYDEAITVLEKALVLKPAEPATYMNLIEACINIQDLKSARKYAEKLLRLQPKNETAYYQLGQILMLSGHFDEAISNYEKSVRLNKKYGAAYYAIAVSRKFTDDDMAFIRRTEKVLQTALPAKDRLRIHFALGKMYNDCKAWDKAFDHFRQGNLIKKPAVLDITPATIFQKTHRFYDKKITHQTDDFASDSEIPVFIVGMPRSGTTLLEKIIKSHPQAEGAGELDMIDTIHSQICPVEQLNSFAHEMNSIINTEKIAEYSDQYLQALCRNRESARRIVDKMPDNILYLGLINRLFPKSHIIHLTRSPLDIGLSCYSNSFEFMDWTNDLGSIVARYIWYRKVMKYWYSVLPQGRIIDVRYEDVITSPDVEMKRIIQRIGLEWDPACLTFQNQGDAVHTASVWQVRQPLYKTSKKRWVNYAHHLSPLINGLIDYLEEDDLQEMQRLGIECRKKWYTKIFS